MSQIWLQIQEKVALIQYKGHISQEKPIFFHGIHMERSRLQLFV